MNIEPRLHKQVEQHPYPLLFATISGAHLYGFPSRDSDYDLRGAHLLPLNDVLGLKVGEETVEKSGFHDGLEIDLVTHDIKKFMGLMLKKNGYVLEQLLSPLIVHTTPEHEELKTIAANCITKHHAHHYLGFAATQWKLFQKEDPPRVKPLLYVYRVLLTGIREKSKQISFGSTKRQSCRTSPNSSNAKSVVPRKERWIRPTCRSTSMNTSGLSLSWNRHTRSASCRNCRPLRMP